MRVVIAILVLSGSMFGQQWSGIIAPARATDWSAAGVTGGIPSGSWTQCGSTISAPSSASAIQSAINACTANHYVLLGSGTFSLNTGISLKNGVALRGQGANLTILNFSGLGSFYWGTYAVGFIGSYNNADDGTIGGRSGSQTAQRRSWTGTGGSSGVYTKGATVLNLASAPTGLVNGDLLKLWENADPDGSVPRNNFFVSSKSPGVVREGPGLNNTSGQNQYQRQLVKVVSIAGSAVTVTPGLTSDYWATANSPQVNWEGGAASMQGLENLTVNSTGAGSGWGAISFFQAQDCWVKGVNLIPKTGSAGSGNQQRAGFLTWDALHITIQDSLLQRMVGGGAGSTTSYGFELNYLSSSLIQNNIVLNVESPMFNNQGNTGNVFAYNYEVRPDGSIAQTGLGGHDGGTMMELWEGNNINGFRIDDYHGTQGFQTLFRDRLRGDSDGVQPFELWGYERNMNVIGSVLGTSGRQGTYSCEGVSNDSICSRYSVPGANYRLGYPADGGTTATDTGVAFDSFAASTIMRWGNWDVVSNANRFVNGEVPTGAQYANSVPASQALPASFYLSAKPNWWPSAKAWPPIGPDVSGGNITGTGGHANTIPAQDCYTSLSGTLANFNATTCYPLSGSTPQAATPVWSPGTRLANTTQTGSLTCSTSASYMCFTRDGSTPATNGAGGCTTGTLYSTSFSISSTETDKAVCNASGFTESSLASQTITIDTTPPDTLIDTNPTSLTTSTSATFTFHATETSTFECKLDAAAYASCVTPKVYSGLADGSHTALIRATDTAGNVDSTPATYTWTVDTTPPNTIIDANPAALSNSASATFTFHSTEAGTIQCKLDAAAYATCVSPVTLNGMADGSHTYLIRGVDSAGNTDGTPASFTWSVDTVAPSTCVITAPAAGNVSGIVTVSANAVDNIAIAGVTFKEGPNVIGSEDTSSPYSVSWDTTGIANASYPLTAVCRDTSGNTTTSATVTVTVNNGIVRRIIGGGHIVGGGRIVK